MWAYRNIFRPTILVSDKLDNWGERKPEPHQGFVERILNVEKEDSNWPAISFQRAENLRPFISDAFVDDFARDFKSADREITCLKDFGRFLESFLLEHWYVRSSNCITHPMAAIHAVGVGSTNPIEQLQSSQKAVVSTLERLNRDFPISCDVLHIFVFCHFGSALDESLLSSMQQLLGVHVFFLELDGQNANLKNFIQEVKRNLLPRFLEDRIQSILAQLEENSNRNITGKLFSVGRKWLSLGTAARTQHLNWNSSSLEYLLHRAIVFCLVLGKPETVGKLYSHIDPTSVPGNVALNTKLLVLLYEHLRHSDGRHDGLVETLSSMDALGDASVEIYVDMLLYVIAAPPSVRDHGQLHLLLFAPLLKWPIARLMRVVIQVIYADVLQHIGYLRRAKPFLWEFFLLCDEIGLVSLVVSATILMVQVAAKKVVFDALIETHRRKPIITSNNLFICSTLTCSEQIFQTLKPLKSRAGLDHRLDAKCLLGLESIRVTRARIQKCFQIDSLMQEKFLSYLEQSQYKSLMAALDLRRSDPIFTPGECVQFELELENTLTLPLDIVAVSLAVQSYSTAEIYESTHPINISIERHGQGSCCVPVCFSNPDQYVVKSIQVVLSAGFILDVYKSPRVEEAGDRHSDLRFTVEKNQLTVEPKFYTLGDSIFAAQQVIGKLYVTNPTRDPAHNVHLLIGAFQNQVVHHEFMPEISPGDLRCLELDFFVEHGDVFIILYSDRSLQIYRDQFPVHPCFHVAFPTTEEKNPLVLLRNMSSLYISSLAVEDSRGQGLVPTNISLTPAQSCLLFSKSLAESGKSAAATIDDYYLRCLIGSYHATFRITN